MATNILLAMIAASNKIANARAYPSCPALINDFLNWSEKYILSYSLNYSRRTSSVNSKWDACIGLNKSKRNGSKLNFIKGT
jgi:hypothetical protein